MRDPLEGLTETGIIRTGADPDRIAAPFQPVHHAAVSAVRSHAPSAALYAYGSVVTGQAIVGASDVDLLTIGLPTTDAKVIGLQLSALFADVCRGVEISAAKSGDFVGESDESFGNRVFLRHYCVLLDGPDVHRPEHDFTGDRRAARGFNGDIGQHARRWRTALDAGGDPAQMALLGHSSGGHVAALLVADPSLAATHGARPWAATATVRCDWRRDIACSRSSAASSLKPTMTRAGGVTVVRWTRC